MGRVIFLKDAPKYVKPYTATIVGGAWDLFHVGHLRFLKECKRLSKGNSLIVIVQSDKGVKARKGLNRPIINQKERSEIISHLSFVDYVLVLNKPPYSFDYLKIIKPKKIIFSKENMEFRKDRKKKIESKFPKIKVIFLDKKADFISTSQIIERINSGPSSPFIKNPLIKRLYELSEKSISPIGKVSAMILNGKKIISEAYNTSEIHAEDIAINQVKDKVNLSMCEIYTLMPPCILCAQKIIDNKISKVFYLNSGGVGDGIKLLKKNNIKVSMLKY